MLCNTIPRYLQAELFSIWPIQFYPLLPVWPAIICRHFQFDIRPWQTRTHCCGHTVADTNVSPFARALNICSGHKFCFRHTKNVFDFVQKHFVLRNKCFPVCAVQGTSWETMCPQQCVLVCRGLMSVFDKINKRVWFGSYIQTLPFAQG